jgi:hypothetical protein
VAHLGRPSPSKPFGIPEEEFRTKVKRIALAPIAVPPRLGVPEPAKLRVDALIETKLREAGFATFPAREWGEVFTRTQQEVGGLFDPRTGDLDEAKVKTILARTIEDIRGRFQLDAVLLRTRSPRDCLSSLPQASAERCPPCRWS